MRLTEAAMRRLVSEARVGRLATIDPDGRPNIVPFCFALEGSILYSGVDQKPKTTKRLRRLENIRRDPRVMVLVDHYEDDWDKVWWVRMRGSARVLDADESVRGTELLVAKYPQYIEDPPEEDLLAIQVDEWLGWSMSPLGGPGGSSPASGASRKRLLRSPGDVGRSPGGPRRAK